MTKKTVLTLIAAGFAFAAPATIAAAPQLAETRSTLKEWVEIRKLISSEQNKWRVERETLNESIRLLETEIENLKNAIVSKQEEANLADQARTELTREEDQLRQASAIVRDSIGEIEAEVLALVEYFPATLKRKLDVIIQRIPRNPAQIRAATLSNRVLNIVGILGEIEKFNSQITLEREMQSIEGRDVVVDTLYIGLAIAYYVDGTQSEAGFMVPAKGAWEKHQDNSLAPSIANAVAMANREATANFVNLPLEIRNVE